MNVAEILGHGSIRLTRVLDVELLKIILRIGDKYSNRKALNNQSRDNFSFTMQ